MRSSLPKSCRKNMDKYTYNSLFFLISQTDKILTQTLKIFLLFLGFNQWNMILGSISKEIIFLACHLTPLIPFFFFECVLICSKTIKTPFNHLLRPFSSDHFSLQFEEPSAYFRSALPMTLLCWCWRTPYCTEMHLTQQPIWPILGICLRMTGSLSKTTWTWIHKIQMQE